MNLKEIVPLRELPQGTEFLKAGDTLVLFGELFQRGYANGLVEEAQKKGIHIIQATVGRRDGQDRLRPLNSEELQNINFPCINIPLEAGFDFELASDGHSPLSRLGGLKLSDWETFIQNEALIEESRSKGEVRFRSSLQLFVTELEKSISPKGNVVFAHLMAGGVPRHKVILALLNRTVRGTGEKYFPSERLWSSSIGQWISKSFEEVTANTFKYLIEETESFRKKREKNGFNVAYSAYGYHGTEIYYNNILRWQSYTPYLQGWAKMKLESYSQEKRQEGILSTVYNCPEILTNSSSIFQGVEIPLYPLLRAFDILAPRASVTEQIKQLCLSRLKSGVTLEQLLFICDDVLGDPDVDTLLKFESWPQHNREMQLHKILMASDKLMDLHENTKQLMTADLSEIVLKSSGRIILQHIGQGPEPVVWLGHDIIVRSCL